MENTLSAEEQAKVLQIVKLGLSIPNAKISMNLEARCISVFDFPSPNPFSRYSYHYEAYFCEDIKKLDNCITLLNKHIQEMEVKNG